jgi:hypothetical protein
VFIVVGVSPETFGYTLVQSAKSVSFYCPRLSESFKPVNTSSKYDPENPQCSFDTRLGKVKVKGKVVPVLN